MNEQQQQQMFLQQQHQQNKRRLNNATSNNLNNSSSNSNKVNKKSTVSSNTNNVANNRKRSHSSSSSTSSSESPNNNMFSTSSSSDSGSSSLTNINTNNIIHLNKKKKNVSHGNGTDSSSADSGIGSTSSSSMPSSSEHIITKSTIPQRLTAQRSVPAFLNKLYNMVEDLSTNDLIRWSKDGSSFIVEKHEEFAKTVLPRFYKHNTFASFVRQLNMYDFHKVPHLQQGVLIAESEHEIWEFSNPHFQRGRPDLLVLVTRKRNRERDAVDPENISLSSIIQDINAVKKRQSTIGNELKDLHRDNEILWKETLNAREKYQKHQEAIEKILQFLTAIFANDHLAISMNNSDLFPKGLIEEAVSLAGMKQPEDNKLPNSSLSNMLSSVLKLYSTTNNSNDATNSYAINGNNVQPEDLDDIDDLEDLEDLDNDKNNNQMNTLKTPSIIDFSKTLNSATRSAQTITQEIDMLQVNIESLANNLGIDSSQFDDDAMDANFDHHAYHSNNLMSQTGDINSSRSKLYAITNDPSQQPQYTNYALQIPPQYMTQQRNNKSSKLQQQQPPPTPQPPQLQPIQPPNNSNNTEEDTTYGQLLSSMNYSDSFGPNYPDNTTNNPAYHPHHPHLHHHQQQQQQQPQALQQNNNTSNYYNGNDNTLLPTGTTTSEYNAMVNDYTDMMRPPYT